MEISIEKGNNRNVLRCRRQNGTYTSADLGPDLPHHDIAHYVVEKQFDLKNGFYGRIKSGMTIKELSDKEVIKSLNPETWLAEILARNLQSMSSGAVEIDQFIELIHWEAKQVNGINVPPINTNDVQIMKDLFQKLCKEWHSIPKNGKLHLVF